MGPGGGTGRQLVAIHAAGFQIEEPGGARDLPQGNTHSAHNTTLSDTKRTGDAHLVSTELGFWDKIGRRGREAE